MVAPVLVAVVSSVAGAVTNNVLALLVKLGEKRYEESMSFQEDIRFIETELRMIVAYQEDQLLRNPSAVNRVSMEEMCDLAYDIEDCLDRIHQNVVESDGESVVRNSLLGSSPYAHEVKELRKRLMAAHQRRRDYDSKIPSPTASPANTTMANTESVGMEEPMRELGELLMGEGQPERLKVISITGFGGSGKTTLANAVYNCPDVVNQFPCRAWLVASEHLGGADELLKALFKELRPGDPANGNVQTQLLMYLVVFDDMEEEQWNCIKSTFPEKTRSRIIVMTRTRALATVCCNHGNNGYVYNMSPLDKKYSKELLEAALKKHLPGLEQSSKLIVDKCDGHPLSLFSVANYLMRKTMFTETDCKNFWSDLGSHMSKEYAFRNLQQILLSNYRSLPGRPVDLKTCLLFVCVFPNGHPIRKSSLIRRWLAEGLFVLEPHPCTVADKRLDELIDRNIIRPIHSGENAKVKTCRAHGIMHEFMLHMSMSVKFIAPLGYPNNRNYRHLFVDGRPETSCGRVSNVNHSHTSPAHGGTSDNEKLRAHSLTICGSAGEAFLCLLKCELLRVLDLKECNDLKDEHLDGISELWHVRYLSLGASISRLPKQIEKLYCLETLDTGKTNKEIELPVEVIKLPHLAHLLGKFKLGKNEWENTEVSKFFNQESNLQTIAGFVTDDGNPGFSMLMPHMRKLSKVKIWCNSISKDGDGMSLNALLMAIKIFIQTHVDTCHGDHSLSLYLGESSRDILSFLVDPKEHLSGYLSSLKLHGELSGLTQFATMLSGLKELCLSSTNGLTKEELQKLRTLKSLEYLKLVNVDLTGFDIIHGDFIQLLRLCLVQCPNLPTIREGALPSLLSLWLLNQGLNGLSGIEIEKHKFLQDLALDSEVNTETITTWEVAAKKHPKKPKVLFFKRVGPNDTASIVKYVATERPQPETGSFVQQEQQIPAVQSSSVEEVSSALDHAEVAGPSVASTKLPSAMNDTAMPPVSSQASILVDAQGLKSSSSSKEMKIHQDTEEEVKHAAQENMGEISSNSQNPLSGGLNGGSGHGGNKGSSGVVIDEPTVEGMKCSGKDTMTTGVDNSPGKVKGNIDEIPEKDIQSATRCCSECSASKCMAIEPKKAVRDEGLKP